MTNKGRRKKMKKWMIRVSVVGLLVVFGLGTGWAAPVIKLGAHAPQTGSLAKHGMEQMKGVRVGAEEFEKKRNIKVD